jgi:hypothetical protein
MQFSGLGRAIGVCRLLQPVLVFQRESEVLASDIHVNLLYREVYFISGK